MKNTIILFTLIAMVFPSNAQELSDSQFSIDKYQTFAFVGFEEYLKENPEARTNAERIKASNLQ